MHSLQKAWRCLCGEFYWITYTHSLPASRTMNVENGRTYSWKEFSMQLISDSHVLKFPLYVKNRRTWERRGGILSWPENAVLNLPGRHVQTCNTTLFNRHTPRLLTPPLKRRQVTSLKTRRVMGKKTVRRRHTTGNGILKHVVQQQTKTCVKFASNQ
jgi:hypothetical protein